MQHLLQVHRATFIAGRCVNVLQCMGVLWVLYVHYESEEYCRFSMANSQDILLPIYLAMNLECFHVSSRSDPYFGYY